MNQNERVARLLGWVGSYAPRYLENGERVYQTTPLYPAYDTDANASRELLAYVKAKNCRGAFAVELGIELAKAGAYEKGDVLYFEFVNATPQQIYAAFCATFARELAELEKQS